MSAQSPEFSKSGNSELDRINERGIQAVQEMVRKLCETTIDVAYDSMSLHLQTDKELHEKLESAGYPEGAELELFVLEDKLTAPRKDGEFVRTFVTKIEPEIDEVARDYTRLHVPVGDLRIRGYRMPDKNAVDKIYVEVHEMDDSHWYAVSKDNREEGSTYGIHEYIPYVRLEEDSAVLSDQGIWQWINERVPEGQQTIGGLLARVLNGNIVPQKFETIQKLALDGQE